jgi:hypothetical protein
MFEVVISQVRTGKVERKVFETREQAEAYVALREAKILAPRRDGSPSRRSLRDFRMEIQFRDCPASVSALHKAQPARRARVAA